jgi:hypothetical protein
VLRALRADAHLVASGALGVIKRLVRKRHEIIYSSEQRRLATAYAHAQREGDAVAIVFAARVSGRQAYPVRRGFSSGVFLV